MELSRRMFFGGLIGGAVATSVTADAQPEARSVSIDSLPAGRVAVYFENEDVTPICYAAEEGEGRDGLVGVRLVDERGVFNGLSMELCGAVRVVRAPTFTRAPTPESCLDAWGRLLAKHGVNIRRRLVARTTVLESANQHFAITDTLVMGLRPQSIELVINGRAVARAALDVHGPVGGRLSWRTI